MEEMVGLLNWQTGACEHKYIPAEGGRLPSDETISIKPAHFISVVHITVGALLQMNNAKINAKHVEIFLYYDLFFFCSL